MCYYGGGVALIGFAELELGENARITGCKATNGAAVYTDLDNPLTVNYPGCFLYANGGRVEGSVYVGTNKIGTKNNYLDSVKATNAIDHTDGKPTTVFTDNVSCEGDIRGGSFHGSVTVTDSNGDMGTAWEKFCGNLSGGTFYGPVTTECHVSGGTYYGGLTMGETAKLSGKPMNTGSELTDKTNIPNPNGKPVTVTYKYGKLGGTYAKQIVQAGETAKTPAEPAREGYTFIGWDKAIPATMPAENITITARWKDIEKPTGEIIIGTDKWQEFLNKLTFGLFFKDAQEVTINAADNSGTVFISYLVTDQDLSEEELESLVYRGYDEPFRIEPNGEYIVYVMLVDASLNITYLRSDRLTLDNVQPVISGVENGKTYCGARTVAITEKYIDTVTVNGTTVELDESDSFRLAPANGGQKIIVADKAGNTTEMTVTVNDGHTYGEWASNGDGTHTRKCTVDGCAGSETKDCSGGKATCRDKAKCAVCGAEYGDIDPNHRGGKLKHVEAKAATTREEGNIEYWYCEACNRYFSDANGDHEITQADTVIPKRQSSGGSSSSSYPITAPAKTENGSVTVSPKNASAGSTVTITVKPDSGYVLETISVTDKNGNDLKLTDKGNGKYTFTMPGSKVEVKVTFMEDNSVLNFFYDVPNDAYYYEAIKWAAENGVTGGVGNSLFAPNQPCTRAQIVTFLWRAAGSPVVNYLMPFTDVDEGAYYAEAVRWAASTGIVTGLTETTFGTDSVCTRAQAAAMIYRCAQAQGKGFTGAWMFLLPFTDVPEWAYESVAWCYMNGVTTGVSETSFAPGKDCTRAQIVTFLWRAFSK